MISRFISVDIDNSLALFQKFCFWRPFWLFFKNAVGHIGRSYQPISLILNSKQRKTTFYLLTNFEENQSKIATVRVPQRKASKMAAMTSSFRNFKIREKRTLQISVRSFVENFIKIDPSVWAGELPHTYRRTHTHTHIHTYTHTHALGSIASFAVNIYIFFLNFIFLFFPFFWGPVLKKKKHVRLIIKKTTSMIIFSLFTVGNNNYQI